MKKKELKQIAQRIAAAELTLRTTDDSWKRQCAQDEILELTGRVDDIEDMLALDEMIQKILEKNLT